MFFSLSDLDEGKKLKNKNTVIRHIVDLNISKPLKVTWELNNIIKDYNLSNNSASIGECVLE